MKCDRLHRKPSGSSTVHLTAESALSINRLYQLWTGCTSTSQRSWKGWWRKPKGVMLRSLSQRQIVIHTSALMINSLITMTTTTTPTTIYGVLGVTGPRGFKGWWQKFRER